MGPTFGSDPGSFQAESCGMLSVMTFPDQCIRCFHVQVSNNVDHLLCCDNQGLLDRVGFAMDPPWSNPNSCPSS
jgi:hypothetical protein